MALGKSHDRFNLLSGSIILGILIAYNIHHYFLLCFTLSFLFATLYLSPDLDIGPKKRAGILGTFLYPYCLIFRHRGLSHRWPLGTLTRLVYLYIVALAVILILRGLAVIEYSPFNLLLYSKNFITNFSSKSFEHRLLIWGLIGFLTADLLHLFLDRIFDIKNGLFRKLKRLIN